MATVAPFRGIRYNPEAVRNMGKVIVPPYDVIKPELDRELRRRHPQNLIHLILCPGHKGSDAVYEKMSELFRAWRRQGMFRQDLCPVFYLYEQAYRHEGKVKKRLGFLAAIRLEPLGEGHIFPHENTFSTPKLDRLQFLRHFHANLEPVFGVYQDRENRIQRVLHKVRRSRPLMDVRTGDLGHRLWAMDDPADQKKIVRLMAPKPVFIADGHHRYEAAFNFSREQARTGLGLDHRHVLMFLTNASDTQGLTILPYHRVLRRLPRGYNMEGFLRRLMEYFRVEPKPLDPKTVSASLDARRSGDPGIALYTGGKSYLLLTLKPEAKKRKIPDPRRSMLWNLLTPALTDGIILGKVLAIAPQQKHDLVLYTPHAQEGIRMVREGKAAAAFLQPPISFETIARLAKMGERMPQKSTYFYPKLYSGLVIREM